MGRDLTFCLQFRIAGVMNQFGIGLAENARTNPLPARVLHPPRPLPVPAIEGSSEAGGERRVGVCRRARVRRDAEGTRVRIAPGSAFLVARSIVYSCRSARFPRFQVGRSLGMNRRSGFLRAGWARGPAGRRPTNRIGVRASVHHARPRETARPMRHRPERFGAPPGQSGCSL